MKIIVALSGGIDSAVSAFLLKKRGYQVEALFIKCWNQTDHDRSSSCEVANDLVFARLVSVQLGIPLHVIDLSSEYWERVFLDFIQNQRDGLTPNPDLLCNREIKFNVMLGELDRFQGDFLATGHYARLQQRRDRTYLLSGLDPEKDQTYFLALLSEKQLKKAIFPLGNLTKQEVRQIAKEQELANLNKRESRGICFIEPKKHRTFLSKYLKKRKGDIRSEDGNLLGSHDGAQFYTIGQRAGLGIGGSRSTTDPWYVIGKDLIRNHLIVGHGKDHPSLFTKELTLSKIHWINGPPEDPCWPLDCQVRLRHRQTPEDARLEKISNYFLLKFKIKQRACAPGQAVVFYQESLCLGAAILP